MLNDLEVKVAHYIVDSITGVGMQVFEEKRLIWDWKSEKL